MISTRLFDGPKFTAWLMGCVDPENSTDDWVERWAARGVEIKHFPVWADRVVKAVADAASGQRRVAHADAASIIWHEVAQHALTIHQWGCPDGGCGVADEPWSSGKMITPFRRWLTDSLRKTHGDKKVMVDGKQYRLANLNLEVPISILTEKGEHWGEAVDRVRSIHNDDLRTVVRGQNEREAKLSAGIL